MPAGVPTPLFQRHLLDKLQYLLNSGGLARLLLGTPIVFLQLFHLET
jgi:hypothetical protein